MSLASVCLAGAAPLEAQDRAAPEPPHRADAAQTATGGEAMVVAAHPLAARTARAVLREGGNALDAAIAAQMVLNVVEPQSSGIGGGGFMLYWDAARRELTSYDGRETAPGEATRERFLDEDGDPLSWPEAVATPLSVGVPGLLAMLEAAHKAHGALSWDALFADAIGLARDGFGVSPRLSALLAARGPDHFSDAGRALFFNEDGEAVPLGTVIVNPDLAAAFELIAQEGAAPFYNGDIASAVLTALNTASGHKSEMTARDLAGYEARTRQPVCAPYRDETVCGMGPPSSGGITIAQIMTMLERFDLGATPTAQAIHLVIEAEKLAYADRDRYLADPDFVPAPEGLLAPDYLARRAAVIDPSTAMIHAEPGSPETRRAGLFGVDATAERPGTTHISIVDKDGNAVALTSSIESAFGSGIMVNGFLLNNQLTDFSFLPVDRDGTPIANRPQGDKRPRSSMSPTMTFAADGSLSGVLGSPGGNRIMLYVVKALVAMIDWDMTPGEAAAMAAFGSRNGPAEVERGAAGDRLAAELEAFTQKVIRAEMTSGLNIIRRTGDGLAGGSDPRREGAALGE